MDPLFLLALFGSRSRRACTACSGFVLCKADALRPVRMGTRRFTVRHLFSTGPDLLCLLGRCGFWAVVGKAVGPGGWVGGRPGRVSALDEFVHCSSFDFHK